MSRGLTVCLAACALARRAKEPVGAIPRSQKKAIVAAVKETAEQLGNTPAVCRSSYIYPLILEQYQQGRVLERAPSTLQELAKAMDLPAKKLQIIRRAMKAFSSPAQAPMP